MKEKTFENKVFKWLESKGIYKALTHKQDKTTDQLGWCIKNWGGGFSQSGIPDIIGAVGSKFFAFELKSTTGVASDLQKININELNNIGSLAMIVYPKDFEELKENIETLIRDEFEIKYYHSDFSYDKCEIIDKCIKDLNVDYLINTSEVRSKLEKTLSDKFNSNFKVTKLDLNSVKIEER